MKSIVAGFKEYTERLSAREGHQHDDDYDEELKETLDDMSASEDEGLDKLTVCIGALAQCNRLLFQQLFQKYASEFTKLLEDKSSLLKQKAICVLDEVMESLEGECRVFVPNIVPILGAHCLNPDTSVRQAAFYGAGVAAMYGGQEFKQFATAVVEKVQQALSNPQARSEDNGLATDNAISALGKVLMHHSDVIDMNNALSLFLSSQPLTMDFEEAIVVNKTLCSLIQGNMMAVLGDQLKFLPTVLTIFGSQLETQSVDAAATAQISAVLQLLQQQLPGDALRNAWQVLDPQQQARLQGAASSTAQ